MKKRKPATRAASTKVASWMEQRFRRPRPTTLRLFNNGDPVARRRQRTPMEQLAGRNIFKIIARYVTGFEEV